MTTLFGGYELGEALGAGGFGTVYRARDVRSGRELAIKVMSVALTPARQERFQREAQLTARLAHPGIVKVHSYGVEGGCAFIAYELVEGARPMHEVGEDLDLAARCALVRDAARALGHAHAHDLVHRDVKGDNVLVDGNGRVRVIDFGIALAVDLERLTQTGAIVGTPSFMAPDVIRGKREAVGPHTDVWSLGVLLYHQLTRELPFVGESFHLLATEICYGAAPRLRALNPAIPKALEAICLRALERDPTRRYANGDALADALDAYLAGEIAPAPSRAYLGVLAVGVMAAVGVAVWLGSDPAPTPAPGVPPSERVVAAERPVAPPAAPTEDVPPSAPLRGISAYFVGDQPPPDTPESRAFRESMVIRMLLEREELDVETMVLVASAARRAVDDPEEAAYWFRRAGERGSLVAMRTLGGILARTGQREEARAWLEEALRRGDPVAGTSFAELLFDEGDREGGLRMLDAQLRRGEDLRAARVAAGRIAYGRDPPDPERVALVQRVLRKLAAADHDDASQGCLHLYELIHQGIIAPTSPDEALLVIRRGAELGSENAMNHFANILKQQGDPEALEWFERWNRARSRRLARTGSRDPGAPR